MDFFRSISEFGFLRSALIASLLAGIVCGIVGTYIASRRLVFLSGGITHSSFGGIGIAYYMGLDPILGATIFAVLSAIGIEWSSSRGRIREDSAIGIVWSVGMALGIIFIYMTPGYAPNLMSFLFGNILTVTAADLTALAVLAALVAVLFMLFMRPVIYTAFDREFARSQGVPVKFISYTMSIVVALTIVLSIRVVGIVLLISLLTLPAVIAGSFTGSYAKTTLWAAAIGTAGNIAGLWISYTLDVPAGASAIIILTALLIAAKLLPLRRVRKR